MAAKRINRDKLRRMRRAIKNSTLIASRYLGKSEGEACALGALALEAGLPSEAIRAKNTARIWVRPNISAVIRDEFGLSLNEQNLLQNTNDSTTTVVERRRVPVSPEMRKQKVLDTLNEIYLNQR